MGGKGDISIFQFIWEIRFIFLFYIVGDGITTMVALGYGQEANFFLEGIMLDYGIYTIFLLKFLYIAIIFYNYKILVRLNHVSMPYIWKSLKYSIGTLGLVLTVNNLMVIYLNWSFVQSFTSRIVVFIQQTSNIF
ncbi:hypothetical protein HNV12_04580 [Methanococcoides sp. SA1]|nr:hypothetical protein [Methanococcoides sp. SA1]